MEFWTPASRRLRGTVSADPLADWSPGPPGGGGEPEEVAPSWPSAAPPPGARATRLFDPRGQFRLAGEPVGSAPPPDRGPDPWRSTRARDEDGDHDAPDAGFPPEGATLCGFRLLATLGRGSFARVYLAEQASLADRPVVLKVTRVSGAEAGARPAGDESETLARLHHAHIVPIYSVHTDREGGLRLLCMPYLGGANLAEVLEMAGGAGPRQTAGRSLAAALGRLDRRASATGGDAAAAGPLPPAAAARPGAAPSRVRSFLASFLARRRGGEAATTAGIAAPASSLASASSPGNDAAEPARAYYRRHSFVQAAAWIAARLAEALEHAHGRGVLHRDIKPSNVLIAADGTPMLLDFNLAAPVAPVGDEPTRLGGTLPYMAPEHLAAFSPRARGRGRSLPPVGPAADLFALGLILFEMLAGRPPFPEPEAGLPLAEALDRMIADRRRGAPPLRRLNPQVPPSLASIVRLCLEFEPRRRYPSAAVLAEDLRRFLDDRPLAVAPEPSPRERLARWLRRHPGVRSGTGVATIAAALLAAAGLVAWSTADRLATAAAHLSRDRLATAYRSALLKLNTAVGPRALRGEGLTEAGAALATYGLDGTTLPPAWLRRPALMRLAPAERLAVRRQLADLLLARAQGVLAELGSGPPDEAGREAAGRAWAWLLMAERVDPRPGHAVWDAQARCAAARGDAAAAEALARRAEATPPTTARDFYLEGVGLAAAGRLDRAAAVLDRAVALDPGHFWARFARGICAYDQGRTLEAAADFDVCSLIEPKMAWPYLNRGLALAAAGRATEARRAYDRALELDPGLVPARIDRAMIALADNDAAAASADLEVAVAAGCRDPAVLAAHAAALDRLGRRDAADRFFARALADAPGDARLLVARGFARIARGDDAGAEADLAAALARGPDARAHLGRAHLLRRRGDLAAARAELDRALRLEPDLADARQLRALILARLADPAAEVDVDWLALRPTALNLYNAACAEALLAGHDRDRASHALALLERALDTGADPARVADDPDFAALRPLPAFRRLIDR